MPVEEQSNEEPSRECSDEGAESGSLMDTGSPMDTSNEYITVYLSEIRKEMQCPICLGIIRKTRTVMECLHRFCRECIDKSMRLGNNECPACRTHCASRRSLRDDPNFDSLIAALYQDIDKYEEEEMALLEEETWRNKQIQANIAETFQRQSEALAKRRTAKATAAAIVRKAHGKFRTVQGRRGRGGRRRNSRQREISPMEDESDYYIEKEIETPSEPRRTSTRKRQRPVTFDSSLSVSVEESNDNSDEDMAVVEDMSPGDLQTPNHASREGDATVGNGDTMVTWARAGARSHTRYGSASGGNSRHLRCMRATVLLESLAAVSHKDIDELDINFTLQPLSDVANLDNSLPGLERPHLCCSPKVSVQQLCSFLMSHDLFPVDTELEIVAERVFDSRELAARDKLLKTKPTGTNSEGVKMLEVLDLNATLGDVYVAYWNRYNNLSLLYRRKT